MTCKDCIHYDVCSDFMQYRADWNKHHNEVDKVCDNFKDKSRFSELPCKVGDAVYIISHGRVKKCEVVFVGISADDKCSYFGFVENYADGSFKRSYSMVFAVLGQSVFLTREEAEAKLKEDEE